MVSADTCSGQRSRVLEARGGLLACFSGKDDYMVWNDVRCRGRYLELVYDEDMASMLPIKRFEEKV